MIFKSRYVKMLECENEQLKRQNAALVDSLLARAGVAPIMQPLAQAERAADATPAGPRRRSWWKICRQKEREDRMKLKRELKAEKAAPEALEQARRALEEQERRIDARNEATASARS
jgi:hypothetical protein